MNALVVINPKDQDKSLGIAFDIAMKKRHWVPLDHVPFTYFKKFSSSSSRSVVILGVKSDLDNAAFEAEWKRIYFSFVTMEEEPISLITR